MKIYTNIFGYVIAICSIVCTIAIGYGIGFIIDSLVAQFENYGLIIGLIILLHILELAGYICIKSIIKTLQGEELK